MSSFNEFKKPHNTQKKLWDWIYNEFDLEFHNAHSSIWLVR